MKNLKKLSLLLFCLFCFNASDAQTEVRFYTSMGEFDIALTDTLTPVTVDSFLARVYRKFYDGLTFHRVIDGFMIQGGDPLGTGTGGTGTTIPDEFHSTLKNVPKALAMANTGSPNTGDCQFFINLVNNSHLNNKHTVFGMVTANFSVVQDIAKVPKDSKDKPLTPVVIDSIRIIKFPEAIAELTNELAVHIYPNPSKGLVNIDLPNNKTHVEILKADGQIVYTTEAKGHLSLDLGNNPAGLYMVHVFNTKGRSEFKLLLQ